MLGITDQLYKFKWGKRKTRSLFGSSACNLRTRMCDRRLVSWLVNSGIWQRRNSEMSLLFLQCSRVNGFLVGLPIRSSIWPIAGEFLDRSKSVAWFYGWKCVVYFSREPRWLPTLNLLSLLLPSPTISYNSLNNARNDPGMHMEQQEETLCK